MAGNRASGSSLRWLWASTAVVVADQLSKAAVVALLHEDGGVALTSFLSLVLTYNSGAAFSFLAGESGWQRWLFAAIATVAGVVIVALLKRGGSALYCAALALILGGAIGNLVDRIVVGRVVDFLLFHYARWAYPAFNHADSAITIGAALLIVDSFRRRDGDPAQAAKGTP